MTYRTGKNGVINEHSKGKRKKIKQRRNKQETINLFRQAAERLLSQGGIKALKVNTLQKASGKSKSLIYDYFGGIAGVLRDVLENNDIWLPSHETIKDIVSKEYRDHGKALGILLLKDHFSKFSKDELAKEISLLELSKNGNKTIMELLESREYLGDQLFSVSESYFSEGVVSIRMVIALLVGGINYLILHADSSENTFCGIDIKSADHIELMNKTLEQIVTWAYEHAA